MNSKWFPNYFYENIYEIDYNGLKQNGVRGLMFDIDNTLCAYTAPEPGQKLIDFFKHLKEMGFSVCLVSNNTFERVNRFNRYLGLYTLSGAQKPLTGAIKKTIAYMGMKKEQVALIGDQIFTDVWGGNRAGIMTILVEPVENRETAFFKLKRRLEMPIIRRLIKETQKNEEES